MPIVAADAYELDVAAVFLHAALAQADIHFQYNGFLLGILLLALAEAWIVRRRRILPRRECHRFLRSPLPAAPSLPPRVTIACRWRHSGQRHPRGDLFFRAAQPQAHLPLLCAGLLCLSAADPLRAQWYGQRALLVNFLCVFSSSRDERILSCHLPTGRFALHRFVALGTVVAAICVLSLGPFLWTGQGAALLSRLFPFKRGLTHAYWAANVWALYCAADRALLVVITRLLPPALAQPWFPAVQPTASVTRGLVGDVAFSVLPEITPTATLVLSVLATLVRVGTATLWCIACWLIGWALLSRGDPSQPSLWALWKRPTGANFVLQVVVNALTSFLFGWHVHEKAILTALVPFAYGHSRNC